MKITLIGMASVGKSYWSAQFEAAGFQHIDLDDLVRQRLEAHLHRPLTTTAEMNEWLSFPDSPDFAVREQLFVDLEAQVFEQTLVELEKTIPQMPVIVNTGGSLVYAPEKYWQQLKRLTTIIYLKMDHSLLKTLADNYLREGRSVIWQGIYEPLAGETRNESYLRCYEKLLKLRENAYAKYADCAVDYHQHRAPMMSIEHFIQIRHVRSSPVLS